MAHQPRPPMNPALVYEALRPYPSGRPDPDLSESAKINATITTLEQCERDFKSKVLSRALTEKLRLNDSHRPNRSDEESALSDKETSRRNNAVVGALRTSWPSHQGPPRVNPAARASHPSMRDQRSRAESRSARMAQLVEETVWKLDVYDNRPKRMRDKYYAYRKLYSRNEGVVPMDIDAGGKPTAEPSTFPKSTTGSTDYDPSRDPRLQR